MILVLGCGNRPITVTGKAIRLDIDPLCQPDIIHDLNELPYPFSDNQFTAIHAAEVLEHTGKQGDWRFFFKQFTELWRILKPNGLLIMTTPLYTNQWAWGDPGHSRVIGRECLTFLSQPNYTEQIGKTAMTDYRHVYKADYDLVKTEDMESSQLNVLKVVKPSRIKE